MSLLSVWAPAESEELALTPLLRGGLKQTGKGRSSQWAEFQAYPWLFTFHGRQQEPKIHVYIDS